MHNLFLGEIQHHVRKIWNIGLSREESTSARSATPHDPGRQQIALDSIRTALIKRSESGLSKCRKDYLSAVARFNLIIGDNEWSKKEIIDAMLNWVSIDIF